MSRQKVLWLLTATLAATYLGGVHSKELPAAAAAAALPAACSVEYLAKQEQTLLLGGVNGACVRGCQPRSDVWSQMCSVATNTHSPAEAAFPGHDACKPAQTAAVRAAMQQEPDYAVLQLFNPCALHRLLRGRTLWVAGDSLMRNIYFALRCFMLDFWDHSLGECAVSPSRRLQKALYQAADTQIPSALGSRVITDVPHCVHLLQGGRICWVHSVRGEEFADLNPRAPGLLQMLQRSMAEPDDIFFLNFGRWHFTNCAGLQQEPYHRALEQLGQLYQSTRDSFPNVMFKVPAHDHTACQDGQRVMLDKCAPAGRGNYSMAVGRSLTTKAIAILGKYGLPVLDTYNMTLRMFMAHIARDCLHYCSPGVPELEIFEMYKALRHQGLQALDSSSSGAGPGSNGTAATVHACVPIQDTTKPPLGWSPYYDSLLRNSTSRVPLFAEVDLYSSLPGAA